LYVVNYAVKTGVLSIEYLLKTRTFTLKSTINVNDDNSDDNDNNDDDYTKNNLTTQ